MMIHVLVCALQVSLTLHHLLTRWGKCKIVKVIGSDIMPWYVITTINNFLILGSTLSSKVRCHWKISCDKSKGM